MWTSLVVQRSRICLAMQGTRFLALVQEDFSCHRATKAHIQQLLSLRSRAQELQLLKPCMPGAHALQQEKPP